MTVCKVNETKIKIRLTDTEVITCFGNYEKLFCATASTKLTINALLCDLIPHYNHLANSSKIVAKITAQKHLGCEITVYAYFHNDTAKEHILNFKNSEDLTRAILCIYRSKPYCKMKSSLYSLAGKFILIIENRSLLPQAKELAERVCTSHIYAEYVREYGKLLIDDNAVSVYGKAFLK